MTRQTVTEAVRELYNSAQIDVLARAGLLARERLSAAKEEMEREKEQPVATLTAA